jgi:cytoskeletal protein CcmA (bactofilin family)
MWNREMKPSSTASAPIPDPRPDPRREPIAPAQPAPMNVAPAAQGPGRGSTLVIKGDLTSAEDLLFEGRVEGRVSLPDHVLTIGLGAQVSAEVDARVAIVQGTVTGNVSASERVELRASGRMTGDLLSPKVQMADGATFSGRLETRTPGRQGSAKAPKERVA